MCKPILLSRIYRLTFPALLAMVLSALAPSPFGMNEQANAQSKRRLPLVRDAEIEGLIKDYSTPIFKAAGLRPNQVEVFLLNRNDFNAFVTGTRMFFNIGSIAISETPNEIKGVLAHETGHIVGGHLTRLRDRVEKAKVMSAIATVLGAGAIAAGGRNAAGIGQAIILGGNQAIQRDLLSYRRTEEEAADRTAVRLMDATRQSSKGLLVTFERFSKNNLFSSRSNAYLQSHPLPRDRIALLESIVRKSPHYAKKDSRNEQLRHDMARAKIAAYTGGATAVRRMFSRELTTAPARYGDAIATFLTGDWRGALPKIDALLKEQPNNAYLHEMRGEILLRSGRPADAVAPLKRAIKLDRYGSGILRVNLGHAYLASGNSGLLDLAIKELKTGLGRDRNISSGYGYLARAYARKKRPDLALAATAEERMLQGNFKEAKKFAIRAQQKLKRGTPEWLRVQDIIDYKPGK